MSQLEIGVEYEHKSTTVRSIPQIPEMIRLGFGALSRLAPAGAAAVAEVIFRHPHRRTIPRRETAWTAGATRFDVSVDGRRLSAWSLGDGPTVLLVHGWGGRGSQMGAFVAPLVDLGYRVVGYDAPGHAASEGWLSSVPAMARAVREIGDRFGPLHAVIAHSLGTAATTLALHAGLSARSCVYVSPPAEMEYFTRVFCDAIGFTPEIANRLQRRIENRFDIRFEKIAGPRLAREMATPPLLVFHDRDDGDVPLAHGERLVEAWAGARMVRTTGLGHRAILRDPAVIAGAVTHLSNLVGDDDRTAVDPNLDRGRVVAKTAVVDRGAIADVVDVVDADDNLRVLAPAVQRHRRDNEKARGRRRRFLEDIFEGPFGL